MGSGSFQIKNHEERRHENKVTIINNSTDMKFWPLIYMFTQTHAKNTHAGGSNRRKCNKRLELQWVASEDTSL